MTAAAREPDQPSLAESASRQVRAILDAAEASAAEIRHEAHDEAEAIREQARVDAGRASDSIDATLRRLEELHGELGALIASLRAGEGAPPKAAGAPPPVAPQAADEPPAADEPAAADETPAGTEQDAAGVRLIALNMALEGTPREETAQFLSENFTLTDPDRLLDEVYASAGA
jgi:hypothetical protein